MYVGILASNSFCIEHHLIDVTVIMMTAITAVDIEDYACFIDRFKRFGITTETADWPDNSESKENQSKYIV